ncbi:MAG TPA: metallophosphoesterase [Longimicrobium sp.]|jgi:3',5'-cyclic AMP phosphodiesterase CpdA
MKTIHLLAAALVLAACSREPAAVVPRAALLLAAGDIAECPRQGDEATAALLDTLPGTVAVLGDNAYERGTEEEYARCYDPSWGRHKARTRPTPGNHEYATPNAAPYYAYFGAAAGNPGEGWYSYELGAWHVVVLNSEVPRTPDSPQIQWLRADLAAHPARCTLAYWHKPRFSSGPHGNNEAMQPFWDALYEAGADVVLTGHDHIYERFAPMTPDGRADAARGIRSFVVGTGGRSLYDIASVAANSQFRQNTAIGIIRFELAESSYRWRFIPTSGAPMDEGSASCH